MLTRCAWAWMFVAACGGPGGEEAATDSASAPTSGSASTVAGSASDSDSDADSDADADSDSDADSDADAGSTGAPPPGSCGLDGSRVRIVDVEVGGAVENDEDERALAPIAIAAIPSGGSRIAWKSGGEVRVSALDGDDALVGETIAIAANSFADLHADDDGGVVLVSRDAVGEGERHCGTLANLCGQAADLPAKWACWDMFLVRFDARGETWAAKLTDTSADHPAYLNDPMDADNVVFIWEAYAHHGRIASDGERFAAYFGAAVSVSQDCVDPDSDLAVAVNIHQGDRMQVVGGDGSLLEGGFGWGCSHSGYERVIWDAAVGEFVAVCKTDNENRIAMPAPYRTVRSIDLWYANLGNLVAVGDGSYWVAASDIRRGEAPMSEGMADVHLLHFTPDGEADVDVVVASERGVNARAPHLAAYASDRMIVAWETSTAVGDLRRDDVDRVLHMQTRSLATGEGEGDAVVVDALGNRYQELRAFPDGSVAWAAPTASGTGVRVARVLSCE